MGIFIRKTILAGVVCMSALVSFSATLTYWQLDEQSGSLLVDAVGTCDLSDTVSVSTSAPFASIVPNPDQNIFSTGTSEDNPSALVDSHGARAVYDETFDMRSSPWTLEGWFRNSAVSGQQGGVEMIALTRQATSAYKGWDLRMYNGNLRWLAVANDGSSAVVATPLRYDDGNWHHVALEWDPNTGTGGWMQLYVDGGLAVEGAGTGDLGDAAVYAKRFSLGEQLTSSGNQFAWQGDLDEFRFSSGLLSPTNFLNYVQPTETLSYWQLDEQSGILIVDAVGSNDLGTTVSIGTSAPFASTVPNPDQSIFSVGTPQDNPAALLDSHGARAVYDEPFDMRAAPWTMEGWFRNSSASGTQSGVEMIALNRHATSGYKGWDLRMYNGTLHWLAVANDGSDSRVQTQARYDDGYWHHVAIQWDPSNGVDGWMRLYMDGTLAVEGAGTGDLGNADTYAKRFAIGEQLTAGGNAFAWQGDLDEFRFSSGLLSPTNFLNYAPAGVESNLVAELSASYRDGQVFIQWNESQTNNANLSVYMHTVPITAGNLGSAQLLEQRIEPHSANDWYEDPAECHRAVGPVRGWILEAGGASLNSDDGLFVHTVAESDPVQAYFAVLTDDQDAADLVGGMNTLTQSVAVSVAPIKAIWQLGPDTVDWAAAAGKPLAIYLHSHQSRPSGSLTYVVFGDKTMGWREGLPFKFKVSVLSNIVLVEPYDRVWINRKLTMAETYSSYNILYKNIETWHYGTTDKIHDAALRDSGTVVNYTERLNLKMLDWVQQTYQTDTNKVYAYGASMGTGVQRLVMQNPDRFASVDLLVPFVDWGYESGAESNAKRLEACCGSMSMMTSDGVTLGERMNLVNFMQNTTRDLPHAIIRVGRTDGSVYWAQKPPYMAAMQANRHGLVAGWDNGGHGDAMRYSIPAFPNFRDYNYSISHFALNKSYPAFSYFSMNEDPGNGDKTDGDLVGFINRGLDWSGILDQANRYEVKVLSTHPDTVYPVAVDVTLRNLQNFSPQPGQVLRVQNRDGSGAVVEEKDVVVDSNGLLTYEAFSITSAQGNTLTAAKPGFLFMLIGK